MGARGRCVPFLRLLWTRSHGAIVRLLEWDGPDVLPTTSHEASGSCVNDSEAPRADDAGNASSRMDRSAASCTAGSAEPARKIVPARTEQTVAQHRQGRQGPMVGSLSLYGVHACFRWCGPFVSRSPERSRARRLDIGRSCIGSSPHSSSRRPVPLGAFPNDAAPP